MKFGPKTILDDRHLNNVCTIGVLTCSNPRVSHSWLGGLVRLHFDTVPAEGKRAREGSLRDPEARADQLIKSWQEHGERVEIELIVKRRWRSLDTLPEAVWTELACHGQAPRSMSGALDRCHLMTLVEGIPPRALVNT